MLDYRQIRTKFTKHINSRQKLPNIYTVTDRRALKTIENTVKINCNQKNRRVTKLHIKCQMLLINCETVWNKRFLTSVSRPSTLGELTAGVAWTPQIGGNTPTTIRRYWLHERACGVGEGAWQTAWRPNKPARLLRRRINTDLFDMRLRVPELLWRHSYACAILGAYVIG